MFSYKILNQFEYGLIKLDKNYKDKYLAIFSNYSYEFNFNYINQGTNGIHLLF